MFCTFFSRAVFVFAAVDQEFEAYSMCGRTEPVYTWVRIVLFAPHLVPPSFFITAIFLIALISMSPVDFLLPRLTPGHVGLSTCGISSPTVDSLTFSCFVERE